MEKIETFVAACQYLKEGEILCQIDGGNRTFFALRAARIHAHSEQTHYVLTPQNFTDMFSQSTFYLYERQPSIAISAEKDEEYYRWQHK